jgi:hypothetical protein
MRPTPRVVAMAAFAELAFDGPSAAGRLCPVLVSLRSPLHCLAPVAARALSYALTGSPLNERLVFGSLQETRITVAVRCSDP